MLTVAALASFTVLLLLASAGRPAHRTPPPDEHRPTTNPFRVGRRPPTRVVVGSVAAVGIVVIGPVLTGALAVTALGWRHARPILAVRRRRAAMEAALPDAIEMLILVVRSGMTPHQAITLLTLRAPAPIRPAFVEVDRRRTRGATLADALRALPEIVGPHASLVADTLAMAERYGTPMNDALEQLADDVRDRRARQAEAEARKLPVRMSFPLVVCTLPSFVLIAIVPAVLAAVASLDRSTF